MTPDQVGSLWLNGVVFGGVLGGPQQALMRGIFAQMQTLQEHVYYQSIQDDTPDILAELLRLEGALQRYNPRILEQPSSPDRYNPRCKASYMFVAYDNIATMISIRCKTPLRKALTDFSLTNNHVLADSVW